MMQHIGTLFFTEFFLSHGHGSLLQAEKEQLEMGDHSMLHIVILDGELFF